MPIPARPDGTGNRPRFRVATDRGDMVLELYPDRAPHSVNAFRREVEAGKYDGASFSRIVRADNDRGSPPIEVIQGCQKRVEADPSLVHEGTVTTGLRHVDGTLSLPRKDGGSGSAQSFFICIGAQPALDAGGGRTKDGLGFAAFGRVVDGMDVVKAIHQAPTLDEAADDFMRGQIAAEPAVILRISPEPNAASRKGEASNDGAQVGRHDVTTCVSPPFDRSESTR